VSEAGTDHRRTTGYRRAAPAGHDRRRDWRHDAACGDADPDLFFPDDMKFASMNLRLAKLICRGCQVSASCLSWALAGHEVGVWGGMTEDERRRLSLSSP
jgi:WhiB family redox-sensing transcriptional regulator